MLNARLGSKKYQFCKAFGLTQLGFEPTTFCWYLEGYIYIYYIYNIYIILQSENVCIEKLTPLSGHVTFATVKHQVAVVEQSLHSVVAMLEKQQASTRT